MSNTPRETRQPRPDQERQPVRRRVHVTGVTQGVGFRPFVWHLARQCHLTGWVQNDSSGLLCEVQGTPTGVERFLSRVQHEAPLLARIDNVRVAVLAVQSQERSFTIRRSEQQQGASTAVPPDIATCSACLRDVMDKGDRRYGYPFANCTNCGPRFTIIQDIPYDRENTTMKAFAMCPACREEYGDPSNRRFHAQPNACPDCGPQIWFEPAQRCDGNTAERQIVDRAAADVIQQTIRAIREGKIVAVKGIGGFHLVCDAQNTATVAELRQRKGRTDKPLAVMVPDVVLARQFAIIEDDEQQLLESKERPIVLLRKKPSAEHGRMLDALAPGNDFVGVLLPYSPLHELIVRACSPLLFTSGNISDEPIARTNDEARRRLLALADGFLLHNRDIHAACDDSVVRCVAGRVLPIRRSRGYAPLPVRLAEQGPTVLAVGGELKSTICVTKDDHAYLSQHVGDVGNLETLESLKRTVDHFRTLFRVDIEAVVGDLHPNYLSSQWARELAQCLDVPFLPVQHHWAHACSLAAEAAQPVDVPFIYCCFDGTGYGPDGAIWGGEFLVVQDGGKCHRAAHLRYFLLPGGDAAVKRPYRTALALLWQNGLKWDTHLPPVASCPAPERSLLRQQLDKKLNSTPTSSMGRLFDAVAALIGVRQTISYEAQAAMELEALAAEAIHDVDADAYSFDIRDTDPLQIGSLPLLSQIVRDVRRGVRPCLIAAQFHHAVARMTATVCRHCRRLHAINRVGLTGGVFQNALLLELTKRTLEDVGFDVVTHSLVPPNDGGLALGQAVAAQQVLASHPVGVVPALLGGRS